jgi:CPA2 family monovalent cation:H+ antiporter-2
MPPSPWRRYPAASSAAIVQPVEPQPGATRPYAPGVATACEHIDDIRTDWAPASDPVCDDCAREGRSDWVSLRRCMTCGHVGCCDSSPNRHARRHHEDTGHHVIRSAEPGDNWSYCLEDARELPPMPAPTR